MKKRLRKKLFKKRLRTDPIFRDGIRLMAHNPDNPKSWWFHPREKDYFDWLNEGVKINRLLMTATFGMKWFHHVVSMPFSDLPRLINHPDTEIASLAQYRLEKGIP